MSAFKDDSPVGSAPGPNGGTNQGANAPRSPAASEKGTSRSQQAFREALAGAKERESSLTTVSGRAVEPVYLPAEVDDDYETQLGFPGQYPFTRGIHANLYRGRLWTMRQFAGFGAAEETNARFKYLLEKGQTGLSTAFDLPTLMGLDSDHPNSAGEVGRLGVAIDTLDDFERLFAGIDLGAVSVSMTINAPAAIVLAFYLATAERQGVAWDKLRGTLQNDILKEYHAQNEFVFPPRESVRLVIDTIEFCAKHVPQFNPVSISGYHIREAGSTAAEELAFTLADGFHYVEQTLERGLPVDDFAPRLSFFFNSHNDFLEEIAKFRAARRIWARHLRERYGAKIRELGLAVSRPNLRRQPASTTARGERRPRRLSGDGGRAGRLPIAAHQQPRRNAVAANVRGRHDRLANAASAGLRNRRGQLGRSARRQLPG